MENKIMPNNTFLGIELGSTRIKAVLTDKNGNVLAVGTHTWENSYENGYWTYSMQQVWHGIADCYKSMAEDFKSKYNSVLSSVGAIGISAMMHGYLPLDKNMLPLTEFRTWRNRTASQAADSLTESLEFNIPERWSVAHLYQAISDGETHTKDIAYLTTLSGYVHMKLTGEKVLGIGDASGMFPVDGNSYDEKMLLKFDDMTEKLGFSHKLHELLPKCLLAGENAGRLTPDGARLIDPAGNLCSGVLLCPPEGDAGTGMVATNSVAARSGNVSAGTSVFLTIVLEHALKQYYGEIDVVATPTGKTAAMVHCNNCTSDIDAWVNLFGEFAKNIGASIKKEELYKVLYNTALSGESDLGQMMSYGYIAGEKITDISEGIPLFMRKGNAVLTLPNFMKTHLFSALATMRNGADILFENEKVAIDKIYGHGGLFKTPVVGQKFMAAALNVPVTVLQTAAEGGAWGMAMLAAYAVNRVKNENLEDYLNGKVFNNVKMSAEEPNCELVNDFNDFLCRYNRSLETERSAVKHFI